MMLKTGRSGVWGRRTAVWNVLTTNTCDVSVRKITLCSRIVWNLRIENYIGRCSTENRLPPHQLINQKEFRHCWPAVAQRTWTTARDVGNDSPELVNIFSLWIWTEADNVTHATGLLTVRKQTSSSSDIQHDFLSRWIHFNEISH